MAKDRYMIRNRAGETPGPPHACMNFVAPAFLLELFRSRRVCGPPVNMQTGYGAVLGAKVFYWTPMQLLTGEAIALTGFGISEIFEVLSRTAIAVHVDGYVQLGGDTPRTYDAFVHGSYHVTWCRWIFVKISVLHFEDFWFAAKVCPTTGSWVRKLFQQLGANTAATVPRAGPLTLPDSPRSRSPAGEPDI